VYLFGARSSHARRTGVKSEERLLLSLSQGILRADSQVINEGVEPECAVIQNLSQRAVKASGSCTKFCSQFFALIKFQNAAQQNA